ncbi:MAG: energy transducer TonB [Gammaproteobacteria bacterium]
METTDTLPRSNPSKRDPFGLALLVAAACHALVILGVSFDIHRGLSSLPERTLDIILVRPKAVEEKPADPQFLAQTSQEGGALEQADTRPSSPPSPPPVEPMPLPAREIQPAGAPEAAVEPSPPVLTATQAPAPRVVEQPKPAVEAPPRPDVSQLLASTQREIDRLTSELDRRTVNTARDVRRKAINASTQEYKYAAYLEAWRKKVERIGNLNYPEEAKRKSLYGNLMLHVAVRADGSVERIRLVRSSGHKTLDDAAMRIVELAAPFAPFPPDIRAEVDVLDITRTWQFLSGNRLFAQ